MSNVNVLHARRHAICPFVNKTHSVLIAFHSLQHFFSLSSLPLRHISQSRNLPLPSIHYFFSSFLLLITNKNVAPKALSYFLRNQARPHTQRKSKHPLRGLSMYLFPPGGIYLAQTKEGLSGVCRGVGEMEEKGVAI